MTSVSTGPSCLSAQHAEACRLADRGEYDRARELLRSLCEQSLEPRLLALVQNDLAVLDAVDGDGLGTHEGFLFSLATDADCLAARDNLAVLKGELRHEVQLPSATPHPKRQTRVAIVSLFFNWPSTGGGTVHTAETADFLARAGYNVRHFCARFDDWGIGRLEKVPPQPPEVLRFDASSWSVDSIQRRFRDAVRRFQPDFVIVTDSWNFKPLLAEAVSEFPYFLRLAAQECLCPLNNVRMLIGADGTVTRCQRHQLATPESCRICVSARGEFSSNLHRADRELAGVGTPGYVDRLRKAFAQAEAVLVVNPLVEAMVGPWSRRVCVVPSGFDLARFPPPDASDAPISEVAPLTRLIYAGLVSEYMKGFHILREACRLLRLRRQDFELVVTDQPNSTADDFTHFIGWKSQDELPRAIRSADLLVFPTVAEEALGRTVVEAMAVGRPVIASRIGGLQTTVLDGATGLLVDPGDPVDLAAKIETLIDDPPLRERMGIAGRRCFKERYTWDVIIERHYRALLGSPVRTELPAN